MPQFSISASADVTDAEALALYESVGWAAYTQDLGLLVRAIRNSSFLVTARSVGGELVGLARAVSDDATICYLQDILVDPAFQGTGVGRTLLEAVQARYGHVRQTVLLTDNEPGPASLLRSPGFHRRR